MAFIWSICSKTQRQICAKLCVFVCLAKMKILERRWIPPLFNHQNWLQNPSKSIGFQTSIASLTHATPWWSDVLSLLIKDIDLRALTHLPRQPWNRRAWIVHIAKILLRIQLLNFHSEHFSHLFPTMQPLQYFSGPRNSRDKVSTLDHPAVLRSFFGGISTPAMFWTWLVSVALNRKTFAELRIWGSRIQTCLWSILWSVNGQTGATMTSTKTRMCMKMLQDIHQAEASSNLPLPVV